MSANRLCHRAMHWMDAKPTRLPNLVKALVLATAVAVTAPAGLEAASIGQASVGPSGLPLPRFVSLKATRVNMRVGPGRAYRVRWLYLRRGLPMEVIHEYDNWRKVRDPHGNEGWILHSLLSGERTAIVAPWDAGEEMSTQTGVLIDMMGGTDGNLPVVARIEAGAVARVVTCVRGWCRLQANAPTGGAVEGYVPQSQLWGVYPDEELGG